MTDDEAETDGVYTDWLANTSSAYGFGHTKDQALVAVAARLDSVDGDLAVDLVEHVGEASVSPGRWSVEEFVSGQRVEIPQERAERLLSVAQEAEIAADGALGEARELHDFADE